MNPFVRSKLDMPPVKDFIKGQMDLHGITRAQAKDAYNRLMGDEIFINDVYQVNVCRDPLEQHARNKFPAVVHLSVKRHDKQPIHDWRDLQSIKNLLVGREHEAIELYPAESRVVDTVNQYHLWVFADPEVRVPIGWRDRAVQEKMPGTNTEQRPFEESTHDS